MYDMFSPRINNNNETRRRTDVNEWSGGGQSLSSRNRNETSKNWWKVLVFIVILLTSSSLLYFHPSGVVLHDGQDYMYSQRILSRVLNSIATNPRPTVTHTHSPPASHIPRRTSPENITAPATGPPPSPVVLNSTTAFTRMLPYNQTNILNSLLSNDNALASQIRKAGFRIVSRSPHQAFTAFKIHSARSGSADKLDGIGAKCDWSITWNGALYAVTATPRIVCIGTRQIEKFWLLVPHLTRSKFIFVTGGGDRLQPLGNSQYPPYKGFGEPDGGPGWKMFTESPNILHVFSENHNMNHSRYSTLPCGFPHNPTNNPNLLERSIARHRNPDIPFDERPIRVLVSDNVRGGPWYQDRILAREYCVNVSSSFCSTRLDLDLPNHGKGLSPTEISHAKFVWSVQNSQFVLCTHGGGLDPSPKAWESIYLGSIPIIQHGTLDDGYVRLPVVVVPNTTEFLLNADGNSPALLDKWLEELRPHYEVGSKLRQRALYRLTHDYWYGVLKDKYDEVGRVINEALSRGEIPQY